MKAICIGTWKKLELFWKKSDCSDGFKIRVWDAVIRAKLCFGLESAFIPKSMREEFDTFHRRGLRQLMQMQTTYGQMMAGGIRTNSNDRVYEEAERIAYPRAADGRARGTGLRAVSDYYVKQRD